MRNLEKPIIGSPRSVEPSVTRRFSSREMELFLSLNQLSRWLSVVLRTSGRAYGWIALVAAVFQLSSRKFVGKRRVFQRVTTPSS